MAGENPFVDKRFNSILFPPLSQSPAHNSESITFNPENQTSTPLKFISQSPWAHDELRHEILTEICKVLTSTTSDLKLSLSDDDEITASFEHQGRKLKWTFGKDINLLNQNGDGLTEIQMDWSWIRSIVNIDKSLSKSDRKKIQKHVKETIQNIER